MYNVYYTFHVFDVNVDGNDLYIIHTFCKAFQLIPSVSLNQANNYVWFPWFSHHISSALDNTLCHFLMFLSRACHTISASHTAFDGFDFNIISESFQSFLYFFVIPFILNILKSLFNGADLISLTDIFRQKVALVYQVAFSKNVIKHYSPALARVDGTVCEQWSLVKLKIWINDKLTCNWLYCFLV